MYSRRLLSALTLLLIATALPWTACSDSEGLVNLGEAIRDDDDDGWFTNDTNQRVTLRWTGLTMPSQQSVSIVVDGLRLPAGNDLEGTFSSAFGGGNFFPDEVAAQRAIGTWLLDAPEQLVTFESEVRLRIHSATTSDLVQTLTWANRVEEHTLTFDLPGQPGAYTLTFATERETFADPSPDSTFADADLDGIFDREEAALAANGHNIGDPERRDILMAITYTDPDWELTRNSREWLITRFRGFAINLYPVVDADDFPVLVRPGQLQIGDDDTASNLEVRMRDLEEDTGFGWRGQHLLGAAFDYAHFAVLAQRVTDLTSQDVYGFSGNRNLIARSHLNLSGQGLDAASLGPEFHRYQAAVLMHELGHNIGLCHPTETFAACPTLPANEMNPAVTVMGTPAEDQPNILAVIANAWQRPLNYSPTQWQSLDLTRRHN